MIKSILKISLLLAVIGCTSTPKENRINRKEVVSRNNVEVQGFDSLASLSVGNGDFAFTTDLTGLQTFYKDYENGVPLGTQSNWGWHTNPNTEGYTYDETLKYFEVEGRMVPYRHQIKDDARKLGACNYFRENPHRLHLGMLGLKLMKANGEEAKIEDIKNAKHHLDLWTGEISSSFEFEGKPVQVQVFCHQDKDMLAVKIESPLLTTKQLAVRWSFSAGVAKNTHAGYDFNSPEKHQSLLEKNENQEVIIKRTLDNDKYYVTTSWKQEAELKQVDSHVFELSATGSDQLELSCLFSPEKTDDPLPDFQETLANNAESWNDYWENGGIVDFSGCTDPRAKELERRTVLSQYLTKIQSTGSLPPAETGLTYNSWYGKYHLEMHWWHIAHFAQWNRERYMTRQLDYYYDLLDQARKTAEDQGYDGVRWQKMLGPDGENSPSSVGSYLVWQQPHIIWFAEQMYQHNPTEETLDHYKKLVYETADFMADFPVWNEELKRYDLLPPLIPAQEHWKREATSNPPFELAYFHWALNVAEKWKERAGELVPEKWTDVAQHISTPDSLDGVYLGIQGATDSYTNPEAMRDHPIVLGAYGFLPGWDKLDTTVMKNTMKLIAERWDWPSTWGWDYPLSAMAAVRLNEPEMAIDFLLKDVQKNTYLKNGHNYQSERLRIYLPGNGGFLSTIALMCAGWEGCTETNPGFPKDGNWDVKWEGLSKSF